ncbi:hypothetical protein HDU83_008674 [Entophlyctis luteolus]|nr:hypothetical protein HDU83_008674 [Entophlyctis luteolus]
MSAPTHVRSCQCGNVSIPSAAAPATPLSSSVSVSFAVKLPALAFDDASGRAVRCLCCDCVVFADSGDADAVKSVAAVVSPTTSECFGITIDIAADAAAGAASHDDPLFAVCLSEHDRHERKMQLRQHFEAFREDVLRAAEARIKDAQAECAWLCDRITAAAGVCETSYSSSAAADITSRDALTAKSPLKQRPPSPVLAQSLPAATAAVAIPVQSIINKEPFVATSPSVGSLLSRHLASPPTAPLIQVAGVTVPAVIVADPSTTAIHQSPSATNLNRKVHFKDSQALTMTTGTNLHPSTSAEMLHKQGGFSSDLNKSQGGRRAMPSPMPLNGEKVVFAKVKNEEDIFSLDDAASGSTERYLGDDEDDDEYEEDDGNGEEEDIPPVSMLSSSLPISIVQDPLKDGTYERKPKKIDEEFVAPHEIVAKSYQAAATMSGSVVGRPLPSASYKKSSVAI